VRNFRCHGLPETDRYASKTFDISTAKNRAAETATEIEKRHKLDTLGQYLESTKVYSLSVTFTAKYKPKNRKISVTIPFWGMLDPTHGCNVDLV
jgi:hypothetical protein